MPQDTRHYRFFAPQLPDGAPARIDLPPDQARHARTVLRLEPGAAVELFDGRGKVAEGAIASVARKGVSVDVESVAVHARPRPLVHVAFAIPRPKRLDWLLEKASELAAASLRAVVFKHSVAGGDQLTDSKRRRWQGHCLAAAKQSGLNFLPELGRTLRLAEYLALVGARGDLRLLGDIAPDAAPLAGAVASAPAPDNVHLLIGPEGGLTGDERAGALEVGFVPVRLGATTLRIETAAVALLAAVTALCVFTDP